VSRRWTVVLACLLATLLVLATGAKRDHKVRHAVTRVATKGPLGPPVFGFNDNSVLMGQTGAPEDIDRSAAVGANVIRYTVNWDYVEPKKGQFNWHGYDPLYASALAKGIRPILVVLASPSWTRPTDLTCFPNVDHCRTPPDANHNGDWVDFVTALVNRYPRAAAVEIWNEPNLIQFWQSTPDVKRYAQLVDLGYDAVKEAQPGMTVLAGSLNNTQFDGGGSVNFPKYMTDFLALKPHFDALALHDYEDAGLRPTWFTDTLDIAREKLDAAGYRTTPIWITEMGSTTAGQNAVLPTVQGSRLTALLSILGQRPYVKAAVIHTMIPAPSAPTSSEYGFAVMNADGTPKPAYCALATARKVASPTGCPRRPPVRTLRACSARRHRARCTRSASHSRSR
jgi:polysaccharide biosynthesis protein PslG